MTGQRDKSAENTPGNPAIYGWQQVLKHMSAQGTLPVTEESVSYLALTDSLGKEEDPLLLKDYAKVLRLSEPQLAELTEFMVRTSK